MRLATRNTLWTLAVAATALLYAAEMEPRETSKEAAYRMNTSELWEAATDLRNVNIWFSWASYIKETDRSPLAPGKRFTLGYRLPLLGDYTFTATVKTFQKEKLLVLEGDNLLRPTLRAEFSSRRQDMSSLSLSLVFQRRSCLFQLQLGLLLRFIAGQQLSQSLLVLQLLTNNF